MTALEGARSGVYCIMEDTSRGIAIIVEESDMLVAVTVGDKGRLSILAPRRKYVDRTIGLQSIKNRGTGLFQKRNKFYCSNPIVRLRCKRNHTLIGMLIYTMTHFCRVLCATHTRILHPNFALLTSTVSLGILFLCHHTSVPSIRIVMPDFPRRHASIAVPAWDCDLELWAPDIIVIESVTLACSLDLRILLLTLRALGAYTRERICKLVVRTRSRAVAYRRSM